jgi:hypothetical protein
MAYCNNATGNFSKWKMICDVNDLPLNGPNRGRLKKYQLRMRVGVKHHQVEKFKNLHITEPRHQSACCNDIHSITGKL